MGVDLRVYSNHKLKSSSFENRINQIESLLKLKIKNVDLSTWVDENLPKNTKSLNEIVFFIDFEKSKSWYKQFNEIIIHSNYQYLSHLSIYDKTFSPCHGGFSQRWSRWMENLGDEYLREMQSEEFIIYNESWKLFQEYNHDLVKKLGGNKIIYFHDAGFQSEEILLDEGSELDEVISKMKMIGKFFKLEMLFKNYDHIFMEESSYVFYEEI